MVLIFGLILQLGKIKHLVNSDNQTYHALLISTSDSDDTSLILDAVALPRRLEDRSIADEPFLQLQEGNCIDQA